VLDALNRIVQSLGFQGDVTLFLALFGLAMARVGTALALVPFLGGPNVPARVKIGLAVIVVAVLYPGIAAPPPQGINAVLLVGLLVKEALVGASLGLLAQLVFYAVQTAGVLIDTHRGMDQPAFVSSQLASNVSVLGHLKFQTAIVLFLAFNGHLVFLRALHASYVQIPLAGFPAIQAGVPAMVDRFARVSGDLLAIALQLAAPVMLALFLVDVSFGVLGKVAGRINVHAESQPAKSLVGLALVFLAIGFLLERVRDYFAAMVRHLYDFMNALA